MQLAPVLLAGDTLLLYVTTPQYKASDGYVLTLRLVSREDGGQAYSVDAAAAGDAFAFNVPPSVTSTWQPGAYAWIGFVTKGADRFTIAAGQVDVRADPATASAPYDNRSTARKLLDAVNAVLIERATSSQQEVSIAGRQLKFIPHAELLVMRNKLQREVAAEDAAANLSSGAPSRKRVLTRFGPVS